MSENRSQRARLQRISLGVTQPMVATVVCAVLVLLFLGASIFSQQVRAERISQAQTDDLAHLSGVFLAQDGRADLVRALEAATEGRYALLDARGTLVGGDPGLLARTDTASAPVPVEGGVAGRLVTHRLHPFSLALPLEILIGLIGLALTAAYLTAHLYTRFVLAGLATIERAFSRSEKDPDTAGPVFTFSEITRLRLLVERKVREARRLESRLRRAAFENPESGLPNLRAFCETLNDQLASADFENPLCVLSLDLDHFQKVSELLGTETSFSLAVLARDRIDDELAGLEDRGLLNRNHCLLAHLQADEFALLLPPGTGRDLAGQVARNLRRAFVTPFLIEGRRVMLGLSGGIAIAPEDGDRAGHLLRRASVALKSLRAQGKEGFVFYQERLDRVTERRLLLEADIRQAVDDAAFWPAFQPKIDIATGSISGCEALARWTASDGTVIPPAEFIPVAEESGLIAEIGESILRQSCAAAAEWVGKGWNIPVAVNVSAAQLDDPTFCDRVLNAMADSGLPPSLLELEITESMAVRDPAHVEAVLKPLRRMGVRLAIDDFGTGHANLAIITRLNFDVFKIDRSFVSRLGTDPSAPAVIDMILAMAHALHHVTVAEGIETPEQLAFLRQRGCTHAQGFFFSGPVPAGRFLELLQSWSPGTVKDLLRKSA